MKKILVLVGSNRKESINRKFAEALEKLADGRLEFEYFDLTALPMYNDDDVAEYPASAQKLKDSVAAADGILFVTPEHNRSIPAILKNAIDWASRPWGQNSWTGKATAIVGSSPGAMGAIAAQIHLRSIMVSLGATLMTSPEVYLQMKPGLVDENNDIANEDTRAFLSGFVDRLSAWVGVAQERAAA
ncbi:NADPH-dependent FMN reductase [Nitratireductor rhodophyticola]|uniref:NAD(P)H-dependent oxidoreductase n=1 Tax=Nitratireductor rhodophyticola TaxID=2854036 RepID=A0ABS7R965_9HYPH|nr:NADPH-dependent FMN reductase [Nitratireductor rhodophyticola]MBY8917479.1 NAD(P)H-dependent oxidoreductase [Nitratireductor rhodophyticola]MBY8922190.1 NAD(P)H-dependent oxidoreductase [Nitratireductor rhodophyticola]MEC9246460.1 NADPH-dependent FMN reductase [Pseudomonadota bacterium]WPZ12853.1 NADPH-dependent FMN reductase [Nitratireductor rhodophyticola]